MGETTEIAWTDATFNPWWGCTKVSPGCEHCYAETFSKRVGLKVWGQQSDRRFFADKHWNEPLKWNRDAIREGVRRKVFCASMADVFEDRRDLDEHRLRLWATILLTPQLDWLLLTKRPQNINSLYPKTSDYGEINERARYATKRNDIAVLPTQKHGMVPGSWPPPNIWLGATAEDQRRYEERWPDLAKMRAAVDFISYEPAIGPLTLICAGCGNDIGAHRAPDGGGCSGWFPDMVIIGGESGGGARPFDLSWARNMVAQCKTIGSAAFVKQLGAHVVWNGIVGPDDPGWPRETRNEDTGRGNFRKHIADRKGGDMNEWPVDIRVREFPRGAS